MVHKCVQYSPYTDQPGYQGSTVYLFHYIFHSQCCLTLLHQLSPHTGCQECSVVVLTTCLANLGCGKLFRVVCSSIALMRGNVRSQNCSGQMSRVTRNKIAYLQVIRNSSTEWLEFLDSSESRFEHHNRIRLKVQGHPHIPSTQDTI